MRKWDCRFESNAVLACAFISLALTAAPLEAQEADLSVTQLDGVATVVAGTTTSYTIVASNVGPSDAPGVTLSDAFAEELTCTWTCSSAGGATCTAGPVAGDIEDLVDLPAGGSATYQASCAIDPSATGTLANIATVATPGGLPDPDPGNNSATDVAVVTIVADLGVTKDDSVASATPGLWVGYTMEASNVGPSDVIGATLSDIPPADLECFWTCSPSAGAICPAGTTTGDLNDIIHLPVGSLATYTALCFIESTASGLLSNTVTIAPPVGTSDPNSANDSATDVDTLVPEHDLNVGKSDGLDGALPGDTVTYSILIVAGGGPSAALGVTVTDKLPTALTDATWTCFATIGASCTPGPVAGDIDDLVDVSLSGYIRYTVTGTIDPGFIGELTNTVHVEARSGDIDANPDNNSATDITIVTSPSSLSATKTASGSFYVGGTVSYTIVITNAGPGTQLDNPGHEFIDELPPELELLDAMADSGTVGVDPMTSTVTWNGAIPAADTVTIVIDAYIKTGGGIAIDNQGTLAFDADGDGTNESSGVTDDPDAGGSDEPTIIHVSSTLEIPTVSTWGFLALLALLGAAGLVRLRRHG